MSRYFIDRPIFAWVLAILTMLFGLLAIRGLPIAQFPALAPPQISVAAIFPGADATTLDKTTHPDHRAAAAGHRSPALFFVAIVVLGPGHGHPDVRAGHQPRHCPGPGQQQGPGGAAAVAAGSAAPGRSGREVVGQLRPRPRPLLRRQFTRSVRSSGHDGVEDPGADQPHQRRRRLPAVRLAICDAHLGRSDQARQLPADPGRCDFGRRRRRMRRSRPVSSATCPHQKPRS